MFGNKLLTESMFKKVFYYIVLEKFKLIKNDRNRSEGWKYAKLSGHKNEKDLSERINNRKEFREIIEKKLLLKSEILKAEYGGLHEKNVKSIIDGKTKSKTDLILNLKNNEKINFSIKKSTEGQVYLISVARFINGFEKHFNKKISSNQKKALNFFFGSSKEAEDIISQTNYYKKNKKYEKIRKYEIKRKRLTNKTLKEFDETLSIDLLSFFKENILDIFNFCFSTGLASNNLNWAEFIWYINITNDESAGTIFDIRNFSSKIEKIKDISKYIYYGENNGGTTIKLPFGFVQWHQAQIQFHHSFKKMSNIYNLK